MQFECRADNSRVEKHFITLRRANLPQQVRITGIIPNATTIEFTVQSSLEINDLPLLRYILKYKQVDHLDLFKIISFAGKKIKSIKSIKIFIKF